MSLPGYLLIFALALVVASLLTPAIRLMSLRVGAVDRPRERKIHTEPTPTLGGLAIFGAVLVGAIVADRMLPHGIRALSVILSAGALMVAIGVVDDVYDLPAAVKLAGQILAASMLWWNGLRIEGFGSPWIQLEDWQSAAVSVLWIVGITNTINFIDGLDGLAAGVSGVSAAALGLIALQIPAPGVAALAAALCGASLGFLRYNFNPARIFMGDTGSQLLGMLLACISILGPLKGATAVSLLVAMLALGVPVFDTSFAVVRRLLSRKPIYRADRGHLHHRLVDRGYSQRQAVFFLYCVSGLLCAVAIALSRLV